AGEEDAEDGGRGGRRDRHDVRRGAREVVPDRDEHRRREQRESHDERDDLVHQPCCSRSSSGSSVPVRLCTSTAIASRSAREVTLTTTSVSVSAWTTGSTAFVPSAIPLKIGEVPPFTYPIASSRTYVADWMTDTHTTR